MKLPSLQKFSKRSCGLSDPNSGHSTLEWTPDCILSMGAKTVSHPAKIGQVAEETGLSIDTIRFYEKQGLLKRSARTESGFRLFGSAVWSGIEFKPNYVEQCRLFQPQLDSLQRLTESSRHLRPTHPQPSRTASIARSRRPFLVDKSGVFNTIWACRIDSRFPTRTPLDLTPFTRALPAAKSGDSNPLSAASTASFRTVVIRTLIASGSCEQSGETAWTS